MSRIEVPILDDFDRARAFTDDRKQLSLKVATKLLRFSNGTSILCEL
jgi:hypothetical protein